jgi:hypothetical protein
MKTPASEVNATDVTSYLASRGWERDEDWHGASVWKLGRQARLLVPLSPEYEDDDALLEEAVRKIAKVEERPLRNVLLDIAEPDVDVQYFRAYPDAPSGTIPLPSGLKAVQSINNLMRSAADTVEKGPHLFISGRRSALVDSFLHRVMLGAAAPGSYVLTARVPTTTLRPEGLDGTSEFSGRTVVKQLYRALSAAFAGAQQVITDRRMGSSSPVAVFSDKMTDGVSANICKALGDLGGEQRNRAFEVGFTWARSAQEQLAAGPMRFTGEMAAILWRAGDELETLVKSRQARIKGQVKHLRERPYGYQARIEGQLSVEGGELSDRNGLWVALNDEQHNQAIQAYREHWELDIEGHLSTEYGGLELVIGTFRVLRR